MNVYQKFRDSKTGGPFYTLVWLSREADEGLTRSQGVKNLLFPLCSRCFVSAWVLDLRKNAGWFTVEKVPFFWSTSYPAKFGAFNGDLELVPSSIGPFLVFFWPSIRRYRIEYLAIYAALATKYFFHTHTLTHAHLAIKMVYPTMTKTLKTLFFFYLLPSVPRDSLREKSRASGPGIGGKVRVGKLKLTFHCEVFLHDVKTKSTVLVFEKVRVSRFFSVEAIKVLYIFYINLNITVVTFNLCSVKSRQDGKLRPFLSVPYDKKEIDGRKEPFRGRSCTLSKELYTSCKVLLTDR